MKTISWDCPHCKEFVELTPKTGAIVCPNCQKSCGNINDLGQLFKKCAFCPCSQFYIKKDFNQALGCIILIIAIGFVPATYGMSLAIMALLDWLIYQRVNFLAVCYRCGAEYRGFEFPKHFKPFIHHIGLKYDKFRK